MKTTNKLINMKTISICIFFSLVMCCLVTCGCKNTANGAGKDIEKMGEKIQEKTK